MVNIANPEDKVIRLKNYVDSCRGESGQVKLSALIKISRRVITAKRNSDKAMGKSRGAELNQLQELVYVTELLNELLDEMYINGYEKI